ncbi:MAG: type IV pilin N-terminal domain-containing protein [Conexivisphaerales archaeon]
MSKYHHKARNKGKKRAISPVIATVILIAITLIAAVAIGGFVFGLFGSFTKNAQVTVIGVSASSGTSTTAKALCYPSTSKSLSGSGADFINVTLTNTGTGATNVTSISVTFGGQTYTDATLSGSCFIGASGSNNSTLTVSFTPGASSNPGEQFTGTVSLANGAELPFTGTFS